VIRALFISLVLAGVCAAQPPKGEADDSARIQGGPTTFDASIAPAIEVKRAKTGHLLVKPAINGHPAGWFIFDTGAGICVISTGHAKDLELERTGDIHGSGVGGGKSMPLYKAKTLTLGPGAFTEQPMMETDLGFLKQHLGDEIAGVIGFGVLSKCVVELDLAAPRIAIHDPKTYGLAHGQWTELTITGGVPSVHATFEEHEGVFRLDTGADGFVTFHQPAVEKWKLLEGREVKSAKLGGVGGFVDAKRGVVKSFTLGGVKQENIEATFAVEAKGNFGEADRDGNIGAGLLKPFTLVLDYDSKRIAFVKKAGAAK